MKVGRNSIEATLTRLKLIWVESPSLQRRRRPDEAICDLPDPQLTAISYLTLGILWQSTASSAPLYLAMIV